MDANTLLRSCIMNISITEESSTSGLRYDALSINSSLSKRCFSCCTSAESQLVEAFAGTSPEETMTSSPSAAA
jgi:hypothetical protein